MNASPLRSLLALSALCALGSAQTHSHDPFELDAPGSDYFRVQSQLQAWQARHGTNWRVHYDREIGAAQMLYGGSTEPLFRPQSDSDFALLARHALLESLPVHGIEMGTLVERSVKFLPLAALNTNDKMTVNFVQQVDGVRVLGGYANVLFNLEGSVLSIDVTGLPNLAGFSTEPSLGADAALSAALTLFTSETGLPPTSVGTPELVIEQAKLGKSRRPVLVWQVDVQFSGPDTAPEGYAYRIDAKSGELVSKRNSIHYFDVSGSVRSMATPGVAPDGASNPEQQIVMPHLRVSSSQGNAVTDSSGNFTIVGASAPLQVTVTYDGTFCATNNQAQGDYSLTTTLNSSAGNSILMNPGSSTLVTAEANGFNWIGQLRDWVRAVDPSDPTADFLATSNVNITSTCNAYYNGNSVNFYQAGGGCANTAFSSVVIHEMGHWLNDEYGSGNGSDGFGEGNADNFSTHVLDDPIVGQDFCGAGCHVRNANNNRQFCGDCCGGCYGGVHNDGEVLMGAMWKVREQLKGSLGAAGGRAASDTLLSAWMNAYDDSQIKTIIEVHYLELDDDDGNINNGTPNFNEIDTGFRQQGFPGYVPPDVTFANVTHLGNTTNTTQFYLVTADIDAIFTPPVTNPTLYYRVNGGSYQSVAMGSLGGNSYGGGIPPQPMPTKVEYYLEAFDSGGKNGTYPDAGGASPLSFWVGVVSQHFVADFEGGTAGWTHGSVGGTQDDWHISSQFGVNTSFGKAGDPTDSSPGQNIWGNDLGPSGWNGSYSANVQNWLRSPSIDLTGVTGSMLSLRRWLTVEDAVYDQATIKVNGVQVYINPTGVDLVDTAWNQMEIDISAIADGNPNVQIEFGLDTDSGTAFGGWNIDDVEILSVGSNCPPPTTYCTAKVTSSLTLPKIGFTGSPSLSAGNFVVTLADAIPNTNGIVFWAPLQANTPFNGGFLCMQPPTTRGPLTITSGSGTASFAVPITAPMVGTSLNYEWWFRDPPGTFAMGLSDALAVTFCD